MAFKKNDDLRMFGDDSPSFQHDKVLRGVCALTQAQIEFQSTSLTTIYVHLL